MKGKKIALGILAAACTIGGAVALFGCNKNGHTHDYATEFTAIVSSDGTSEYHTHKCKIEGCNVTSGSEKHDWAVAETAATCTTAKTVVYTCKVCNYSKTETEGEALGHDYEWSVKDNSTHTVVCKNDGCAEAAPAEEAHKLTESIVGNYVVNTCSDCGAELAEVQINLFKRINDKQSTEYTGADLKVSLYKIGDGKYTKVYEATADRATGVATLKILSGAYWIRVEDQTNGYLSVDASWIRFNNATAQDDNNFFNIILSEPTEFTYKLLYDDNENDPASGVTVKIHNVYNYQGEASMLLCEGVTDANGEVTFTMASSFDLTNSGNLIVEFSGIDKENYKSEASTVLSGVKDGAQTYSFYPTLRSFTIKVKTEENFVEGVGVKLTMPEYSDELQKVVDKVVASGTTDENGQFVTEIIDNYPYKVVLDLPDEIAADWKIPSSQPYVNSTGALVVTLVGTPTYNLSVSFPSGATFEKSGIKLTVKDLEDNVVAEGLTNEDGKFIAKLEFAKYKVYIDESTIPEGYTVTSSFTTVPTTTGSNNASTLNKSTNSVTWTVANIKELIDGEVTVEQGSTPIEGVVVKLYLGGELKYTSEPTNAEGKTALTLIDMQTYDLVLENLPANTVCSSTKFSYDADFIEYMPSTINLKPSANFALTIKDADGNALEGATVSLVTYAYSTRNYYTITEEAKGVTDASGAVNIAWLLNKNYTVNVIAADGTKYFAQLNLSCATQGETVTQELTVYAYDDEMPLTGNKAPTKYYTGDFIDKEVLVTCSSKRNETFAYMSSDGAETLATGTYKFEILNPCEVDYKVVLQCGYDDNSWGLFTITEPNDYLTFEKDESGNIISVTVNFDNANNASWFNICIGHDVGEGEAATDLFRLLVKVTKVEA